MVTTNVSESLINVVKLNKPKVLTGLNQKVRGKDGYFYVPHRNRARGVGGIFLDDHNTGDWDADFAFIQDVGRAFLMAYLPVTEKRRNTTWTDADKDAQLVHRGLYAEYNLVYDRGTKFGLETGHNPDAVLMSLPPMAKWV